MRIATFNVNSVRSRLHILEKWIEEYKPDFLFLQETKTRDEFFPEEFFSSMNYKSFFCGEKSYNGIAVAVKKSFSDFVDVTFGFDDDEEPDFKTRVLQLNFINKEKVCFKILNTYVPQGKTIEHSDFQVKKQFFSRVKKIISKNLENKFAWVGDLNVAPEKVDLAHPEGKKNHVCFCDEIREKFADTKEGLVDILRFFKKEPGEYTFFDYRVKNALERNIGWRIDHILVSQSFAENANDCFIDISPRGWDKPSDHVPLVADFNI